MTQPLDMLVIGAHPDDAELYAGGMIARLATAGRRVGILDLTRGERGTRGSPDQRAAEAAAAAAVLGLAGRWNLGLPDAGVMNNDEQRLHLVEQIRALRPRVIVSHWHGERHPDHNQAHALVHDALHLVWVGGIKTAHERHRPAASFWFPGYGEGGAVPAPAFIVDISELFEQKMAALRCYASQFAVADISATDEGPATVISAPGFMRWIEARARFYGQMIEVEYGEPFLTNRPLPLNDPLMLY